MKVGGAIVSRATPAHQDHFFFRQRDGSEIPFFTAWTPLMDIDEDVGGLGIAKGSTRGGFYQHHYVKGQQLGVVSSKEELRQWLDSGAYVVAGDIPPPDRVEWMRADYHPGDLLIFHRLMLHRGLVNNSSMIRISGDFRYQRKGTPTLWRSRHLLSYALNFYTEIRRTCKELGLDIKAEDRLWNLLVIEGPSKNFSLKERIQKLVKDGRVG